MDPEDLLDQEVEELPGLPDHSTANMDALKALDALDVSYRCVFDEYLANSLISYTIQSYFRACN